MLHPHQQSSQGVGDRLIDLERFDFKNSTIIKPPSTNFDTNDARNRKYTRVVIDSRDRDVENYSSPSSYVIQLPDDIQDVCAVELQLADILLKAPIVQQKINDTITFNIDGVPMTITMDSGDYSNGESLAAAIAISVTTMLPFNGATVFTGSWNSNTDRFTFTCDVPFTLDLTSIKSTRSPYLAKVLGFMFGKVYTATLVNGVYTLTGEFRKNTDDNRYIILQIDNFSLINSSTSIINKSFALLGKPKSQFSQFVGTAIRKDFNPPISKLTKIRVNFYDYYGNLYDFQNHDHRFELVFESYKQLRKYQSYISN